MADGSGATLTSGSGTRWATLALGHIAAYGESLPTNVTRTLNASGASATLFKISTPIDVLVMEANTESADYTLSALLLLPDNTNTWTVGGQWVNYQNIQDITTTGTYGAVTPYVFAISIPFSNTSGSFSNIIDFYAQAN